jgi:transcriptional regulator with XRE-family HTH domain
VINPTILGRRIRNFRKRANLSQLQLETEIGASSGTVSRIENGEVNPTKETVEKIGEVLRLSPKEISYLVGPIQLPATEEEVNKAIEEVKEYFSQKNVFAYLIDDRFRMIYISEGFRRLFAKHVDDPVAVENQLIGDTMRYLVDRNSPLFKFVDTDQYERIMLYQIARFHYEVGFMEDDFICQETIKWINANDLTKKIYEYVKTNKVNLNSYESKVVKFKFGKIYLDLSYAREPLHVSSRFETIDYYPTNKLIRFISKFASV